MKFKRRFKIQAGPVDITPIINVVFLLLIFFMLSSSFILQPGIEITLPKFIEPGSSKEENLIILLTADNQIFFNNELTTFTGLSRRIRSMRRKNPDGMLIIKADINAKHGDVVEIMNIARQSGIKNISIATQPQ